MNVSVVVIPIAMVLFTGWVARRTGLVPKENWPGIETLSYRILMPAILIHAIAEADLNPARIGTLALALLSTVALLAVTVLAVRFFITKDRLGNPALSSLFQTSVRWNAFIALAAADLIAGAEGVLMIAVAMAILIPIISIGSIVVVAALVSAEAGLRKVVFAVATNPLVIACVVGLAVNLSGLGMPEMLATGFEIVGRAALGLGLLCVGASIEIRRFVGVTWPVIAGVIFRPILAPAIFLAVGLFFGLSPQELTAGVLVNAVPGAINGYFVARAMGGDAELYADTVAWQTIVCLVAMPAYLLLAASL